MGFYQVSLLFFLKGIARGKRDLEVKMAKETRRHEDGEGQWRGGKIKTF